MFNPEGGGWGSHLLLMYKITVHVCKINQYVYYNLFLMINNPTTCLAALSGGLSGVDVVPGLLRYRDPVLVVVKINQNVGLCYPCQGRG